MHRVRVLGAACMAGLGLVLPAMALAEPASSTNAPVANTGAGEEEHAAKPWTASSDWNVSLTLGYDSEYIIRGTQISKQDAIAGLNASWDNHYAGAVIHVPAADDFNSYPTKIVAYGGTTFDVAPNVYGDVGFNGYLYPDDGMVVGSTDSFEPYMGFGLDHSPISPAVYAYYDVTRERYTFEATGSYTLPLGRTDFVIGGRLGATGGKGKDFGFAQADAELVQNINAKVSLGIGAHFAASTEDTFLDGLAYGTDTTTWFGVRLKARRN